MNHLRYLSDLNSQAFINFQAKKEKNSIIVVNLSDLNGLV